METASPALRPAKRHHVLDWTVEDLERHAGRLLAEAGEPSYRLRQMESWLYRRTPERFSEMSDLPKELRARLEKDLVLHPLALRERQHSVDGTQKFLWGRDGRGDVESVLIPDGNRVTYCISSQAGCAVKCPFCATGHGGFQGQLSTAEIVDQVVEMRRLTDLPATNLVFMGMGEPLLNLDAVLGSIEILTHPRQLAMGDRRITVSTVGLPDGIRELARRFPRVNLALSLHAARDELRDVLVPMNRKYPLAVLLETLRQTSARSGRPVTLEYVLLPGVNDALGDADDLAKLLGDLPSRINLIGFNPFPGAPYRKPELRRMLRFRQRLDKRFPGAVTLRRSRGADIQGACGQLSLESTEPQASSSG